MNRIPNMPTLARWVEVRDNWYDSYEENGKLYVIATLSFEKHGLIHELCGYSSNYYIRFAFWGNDDTGLIYEGCFDTLEEVYKQYKRCRKFLNHLKKMKALDLKRFLLDNGFVWA